MFVGPSWMRCVWFFLTEPVSPGGEGKGNQWVLGLGVQAPFGCGPSRLPDIDLVLSIEKIPVSSWSAALCGVLARLGYKRIIKEGIMVTFILKYCWK